MRRVTLSIAAAFALSAAIACGNIFGPDGPEINVSLDIQPQTSGTYTMEAIIGGQRVALTSDATHIERLSRDIRGRRFGDIQVEVGLQRISDSAATAVVFAQRFEKGKGHWIAASVGRFRPAGLCIGQVIGAPIRAGDPDSLFVMYGGLEHGAIC